MAMTLSDAWWLNEEVALTRGPSVGGRSSCENCVCVWDGGR
jgi:hypothetical protein